MRVGPSNDDVEDARLAESARSGDAHAFEQLLTRHETRVFRVLRLMGIPSRDREDLAQDVFVRVFRSLPGFDSRRPFRSWIYRITVNVSHDHRLHSARRGEEPTTLDHDAVPESESGAVEDRVVLRRRLEAALGRLSERERAVFVLTEIEGCDSREVARSLGITTITVRRHLGRAREHLRRLLDADQAPKNVSSGD